MNSLVAEIFDGLSEADIERLRIKAGVTKQQLMNWKDGVHSPKVDTFSRVALCAGYKLVALPIEFVKEKPNMIKSNLSLSMKDGRQEIRLKNQLVGYVQDDELFAIDRKNFAIKVSAINHSREIIGKLTDWRKAHGYT